MSIAVTDVLRPSFDRLPARPHQRYWFDDGSLLLRADTVLYKVHRSFITRHSTLLSSYSLDCPLDKGEGLAVLPLPEHVSSPDVDALLEHLYHDVPLDHSSSLSRLASLLRVSDDDHLGFPAIHALAKRHLELLFPASPHAFIRPSNAEEPLALAIQYGVTSIQKPLFYSVATHPHSADPQDASTTSHPALPAHISAKCDTLLDCLVAHFTPILFTVATAGHMHCTDIFAEKWMPLVIQPALDENGLCHPLETLDRIIAIDWAAEGLCAECIRDKIQEWRGEQNDIWMRMDAWLR